ncbi:MAG: endonuclease/exonuclease/phosphatase family protein [Pseudomonadota bacterium]
MLLSLLLLAACAPPEDSAAPTPAVLSLATQNAGTSTSMAVVSDSPDDATRAEAEAWYDNNLCRTGSEAILRDTLAAEQPDLFFLQEAWHQPNCDEEGRPPEMAEAPWVCSAGDGWQMERLLPDDWSWACAAGYPDNCLTFSPSLATPAGCDGRDCSALLLPSPAPCGAEGRIAYLPLDTAAGPLVAVVVHTNAGVFADDIDCRAAQLQGIQEVLAALPTATSVAMAGDFNLDPAVFEGADAAAYAALMEAVGLTELDQPEDTHRVSHMRLDHVLVRGAAVAKPACSVRFLDAQAEEQMMDHGWVGCR